MTKKKKATKINTPKEPRFQKLNSFFANRQTQTIMGLFFVVFSIFLFVAFASFLFSWQIDQSEVNQFTNRVSNVDNLLGKVGNSLSHFFIFKGFGIAVFIFPILLFLSGVYLLLQVSFKKLRKPWFWGVLGMVWFSILFGFFTDEGSLLSGIVGYELNIYLAQFLGEIGIVLLLTFTMLTYLAIRFKLNANHFGSLFRKKEKSTTIVDSPLVNKDKSIVKEFDSGKTSSEENKSDFELSVENLQPTISNYLGKMIHQKKKLQKRIIQR